MAPTNKASKASTDENDTSGNTATHESATSNPPIYADVEEEVDVDDDPFAETEYDSDLTSLSSSVREHVYENGRRYHAFRPGTYVLPNDDAEQERLDMMHHMISLLLEGRLHECTLPPNKPPHRILDVGTGTGVWAVAMAHEHPQATVIGVDLSPIQPGYVPPNCMFEIDDVNDDWIWPPFDFIHSRNIAQGIKDWDRYVEQIYSHLNPGGIVEMMDAESTFYSDDDTLPQNGFAKYFQECYEKAAQKAGIQDKGAHLKGHLEKAGFQDIRVVIKKLPLGMWPKDKKKKHLGQWGLVTGEIGLRSYSNGLFTRYLGMSANEVEVICAGAAQELRRPDVHAYFRCWFVSGRKPETA